MALWKLLHLGTPMYGYILLAFENPNGGHGDISMEWSRYHWSNEHNKYGRRMWAQETHRMLKSQQTKMIVILIPHAILVVTKMTLWQLALLGTLMYCYMLL